MLLSKSNQILTLASTFKRTHLPMLKSNSINMNILTRYEQRSHYLSSFPLYFEHSLEFGFTIGLIFLGLRYVVSRKLTYHPCKEFVNNWENFLLNTKYEDVYLPINEKVKLHGWYFPNTTNTENETKMPPLLFLHGNAGNISHRIQNILLLQLELNCDIFIFDYRGFGKSSLANTVLEPNESALIEDSVHAFQKLLQLSKNNGDENDYRHKPLKPVIFGRSLGGAVAIHSLLQLLQKNMAVDEELEIGGIIIENTFTDVESVMNNNPFFNPFINDKWDNIQCLTELKNNHYSVMQHFPILMISAKNDSVLHPLLMKNLKDFCINDCKFENVKFVEFDSDHMDTFLCDGYLPMMAEFLNNTQNTPKKSN